MQTEYKYIRFVQTTKYQKTSVWQCRSIEGDYLLGTVKWYSSWRQYCYFTNDSIYHNGCLRDIAHFIDQLMEDRKQQKIIDKLCAVGEINVSPMEDIMEALRKVEENKDENSV